MNRLPPLNALHAFVAAARHCSFTRAAEELHVTPGAVSHQVKALETFLGVPLFRRGARSLELTEAGRTLLPGLGEGFERIAQAVGELAREEGRNLLTVQSAPSFTAKWLVPRIGHFTARHPDVELRISSSLALTVLRDHPAEAHASAPEADVTIRFGAANAPGCKVERLCTPPVAPLCSPRLLEGEHALRTPADLRHHVLLHDETVYFDAAACDWAVWLHAAGIDDIDAERGPRFSHASHAIGAAAEGLGVALTLPMLAGAELRAGRLVMPFELSLPSIHGYYLIRPRSAQHAAGVAKFRAWLREELRLEPYATLKGH